MVVTVWGAYQTAYYPETCRIDQANYRLGLMMYSSYFLLFCSLFIGKFCSKSSPKATRCGAPQHGLSSSAMALITSDCGAMRFLSIKWPESPRFCDGRSQDLKAVCNANITGDTAGFFHGRAMVTDKIHHQAARRTMSLSPIGLCCNAAT